MAQSDDVTTPTDYEFHRETLPEGEARLVLQENNVTVTFEGDEKAVNERFLEHLAESVELSPEEIEAKISDMPFPRSDKGVVSADEFSK